MKLGMTLGLTGSILALLLGLFLAVMGSTVGGIASQFGQTGTAAKSALLVIVSIGLPVMAIIGSALLPNNTRLAMILMAVPAVALILMGLTGAGLLPVGLGALIAGGAASGWNASNMSATGQ